MNECKKNIQSVVEQDWKNWKGLPTDCTHGQLKEIFSGGDIMATAVLSSRPAKFRMYSHDKLNRIDSWFNDDDHVMLLIIEKPLMKFEMEKIRIQWGEPDKKFIPPVDFIPNATQLIYASKGATFYWREHSNEIIKLSLYPPATAEYYMQNLGAMDRKRYFPRE
jgi:hypothetical protein